jgi:transposase
VRSSRLERQYRSRKQRHGGLHPGREDMTDAYVVFVGVDWGTGSHQVCVLDGAGGIVVEREVAHDGPALAALVAELLKRGGKPESVAVAIETPRGPVVETLVMNGFHVHSVNPKQLDRFRDRHSVAGSKDDRRDAFVLANSLRTDRDLFRRVVIDEPTVILLREIMRVEDDAKVSFGRESNQLRDVVLRVMPELLRLCPAADEPWFWSILELVETPARGQKMRLKSVERVLRERRITRLTAEQVLAALRSQPIQVAPGVAEAAAEHMAILIPRLRLLHSQIAHCEKRSSELLEALAAAPKSEDESGNKREHRDVEILKSLPGVGRLVAATMLAEAGEALRTRDYHALRTLSGVAPVTKQSGKKRVVLMRRACNHRLRDAFHHMANTSVRHDDRSKALYAAARARGQTHPRALRGVADRLLVVLVAMLRDGTLYQAAHSDAA